MELRHKLPAFRREYLTASLSSGTFCSDKRRERYSFPVVYSGHSGEATPFINPPPLDTPMRETGKILSDTSFLFLAKYSYN